MSSCPKCGAKIEEEMAFCPKCGASLKVEQPQDVGERVREQGREFRYRMREERRRLREQRRKDEKSEKDEKGEKSEQPEKYEKREFSFVGPLIGGLVLLFLGFMFYAQLTSSLAPEIVWALMFITVGVIIIVAVIYGATMTTRGHPKT
jgi:cation transport ATPase